MPEVKKELPPDAQASVSRVVNRSFSVVGCTSPTIEHDTTFFPDARIRAMSSIASPGRMPASAV